MLGEHPPVLLTALHPVPPQPLPHLLPQPSQVGGSRHQGDDVVPIDPWVLRAGHLVEVGLHFRWEGFGRIHGTFRTQDQVVQLEIVGHIGGAVGQDMGGHVRVDLAQGGHAADATAQLIIYICFAQLLHRSHLHMVEIGVSAESPDIWILHQEPGEGTPLAQSLLQRGLIHFWVSQQGQQLGGRGPLTGRVRVQEGSDDRLLDLPTGQGGQASLNLAGLFQFTGQNRLPLLPFLADGEQFVQSGGEVRAGGAQEGPGANQRRGVLPGRFAESVGQQAQRAPRALELVVLGPLLVEDLDQVGVEGVTFHHSVVGGLVPLRVSHRQPLERRHHRVHDRPPFRLPRHYFQEPPPQHLGHIVAGDRLHRLGDAPKDVFQRPQALNAGLVLGLDLGGDQTGDQCRALNFGRRLGQHLVKVLERAEGARIVQDQLAVVPDRLVHQHQRARPLLERRPQQVHQQRLGGDGKVLVVALEAGVAGVPSQLVRQCAPQSADAARPSIGAVDF